MKNNLAILTLIILLLPSLTNDAHAQEFSAGIYPPVIQATTLPPTVIKPKITITNKTQSELPLKIEFKPFRPSGKGDGSLTYPSSTSLVEYLIFPQVKILDEEQIISDITLGPSESKNLTLQIDINRDTPLSDYYFSVVFISNQNVGAENVAIPAGIATNVLLSVGQNTSKDIKIESFNTPGFMTSGPVLFTVLLKNSGEHVVTPTGSIEIHNMLGNKIDSIKLLPEYILSNSTRFLTEENYSSRSAQDIDKIKQKDNNIVLFSKNFLMGKYEAILNGHILENPNIKFSQTLVFYAIPLPYISGLLLVLVILIVLVRYVRSKKRSSSNSNPPIKKSSEI